MFLIKKYKTLYKVDSPLLKRDYGVDMKKYDNVSTQRDIHPFYIDIIFKNNKYYIIDINYTHSSATKLNGIHCENQVIGHDLKENESYIVIDDIRYDEVKSINDLNNHIDDIQNNYQDKEVTQFPHETHQKIRQIVKTQNQEIEYITPVAQNKEQYIGFIDELRNKVLFDNIKNKID